jgi:apolipoprotein D and lipocalin family protein
LYVKTIIISACSIIMRVKNWQLALAFGLGATAVALSFTCSASIPKGAKAIKPFDEDKYLGQWFEIARFDFRFEKNLSNVTANYSKNADGSIRVDNKGYSDIKGEWKESIGKAKFAGDKNEAKLKVSFFGPFYAPYNVIAIDKNYQYALVAGKNLDYLWILSREKTIPAAILTDYLKQAQSLGYDIHKLIWTKQDK